MGVPIGVQQKPMRHAHASTTGIYGGALMMSSKHEANSDVRHMALRNSNNPQRETAA